MGERRLSHSNRSRHRFVEGAVGRLAGAGAGVGGGERGVAGKYVRVRSEETSRAGRPPRPGVSGMSDQEKIDLLVNWLRNMPWWEQVKASLFVDFQRELHALQLSDRIKTENLEALESRRILQGLGEGYQHD